MLSKFTRALSREEIRKFSLGLCTGLKRCDVGKLNDVVNCQQQELKFSPREKEKESACDEERKRHLHHSIGTLVVNSGYLYTIKTEENKTKKKYVTKRKQ